MFRSICPVNENREIQQRLRVQVSSEEMIASLSLPTCRTKTFVTFDSSNSGDTEQSRAEQSTSSTAETDKAAAGQMRLFR